MNCRKHPFSGIPCPSCMMDEYLGFQKINDDLIKEGKEPIHDVSHIERELRNMGYIP